MKKLIIIFLIICSFYSCRKESGTEKDIAKINIDFTVERFDRIFAESSSRDLPKLKEAFPFLFSSKIPDSIWVNKMQDTIQIELSNETNTIFNDFENVKSEIVQLFKHLKYYFPEFKIPRVITVTSNVDYRNKVIVTDSIVLIALDNYLGEEHEFYGGIPQYLVQNFNKNQITPDLADEYAKKYSYQSQKKTFLDDMIYFGKRLYFKDVVLPLKTDSEKLGYTSDQLDWAMNNESEIWRYFIENELLYSTDASLSSRFLNPAPFSKFYLELDAESPGRIGQYMGWQIVRSYMENNTVSLNDMLIKDPTEIYISSKFKPRK